MKKFLLASTVLAALTGVAAAADLPSRVAPPVYAPPIPVFTWTGAYFGINAGYAFDHEGRFNTVQTGVAAGRGQRLNEDGFTGGGQIGYNYQIGGFGGLGGGPGSGIVVGIEADAAYTDLNRARTVAYGIDGIGLAGTTTTYRSGLDFLGTVRGRLGYSFGQFMIYGTGGYAYGGVDNRVTVAGLAGGVANGSRQDIETGVAYGGGIEYALPTSSFLNFFKSSAVTLKAEYLHYDLGTSTFAVRNNATRATANVSNDGDIARIGINYKFGSY